MLEPVHVYAEYVLKPLSQVDVIWHVTDDVCWMTTPTLIGNTELLADLVPRKLCHLLNGQARKCEGFVQYRRWVAIQLTFVAHDLFGKRGWRYNEHHTRGRIG